MLQHRSNEHSSMLATRGVRRKGTVFSAGLKWLMCSCTVEKASASFLWVGASDLFSSFYSAEEYATEP